MSDQQQSDVFPLLSSQQPMEQCSPSIPTGIDTAIPQELIFNGKCKSAEEYKQLVQLVYRLLSIKDVNFNGEQTRCLHFKFLEGDIGELMNNIRLSIVWQTYRTLWLAYTVC